MEKIKMKVIYLDAETPDMLTATIRLVFCIGPIYWSVKIQNGWSQGKDRFMVRAFSKLGIYPEY